MSFITHRLADMADPDLNPHFRRRWSQPPMTARELEHAADLQQAVGNARRAELLSWAAHQMRSGSELCR